MKPAPPVTRIFMSLPSILPGAPQRDSPASAYSKIWASASSGALRSLSDSVMSAAGTRQSMPDRRVVEPYRPVMLGA